MISVLVVAANNYYRACKARDMVKKLFDDVSVWSISFPIRSRERSLLPRYRRKERKRMDEEKLQERACKLAEEEEVPVLPPFLCEKKFGVPILYGGIVKIQKEETK